LVYGANNETHKFFETILYKELEDNNYLIIKFNRIDKKDDSNKIYDILDFNISQGIYN
jgi:hypothetical protein